MLFWLMALLVLSAMCGVAYRLGQAVERKRQEAMVYTTQVCGCGHIMTMEEFRLEVEGGGFIDYDGYGHPVKRGWVAPGILVKPSDLSVIPLDATHIEWYNK